LREIQALIGRRRLGAFWALAEPLLHLLAFSLLMSAMRGRGDIAGHPYPVFMIVGLAPFLVYRRIALMIAEGAGGTRALFAYKQITPIDTFVARSLVMASLTAIVYIMIVAGFAWYGWDMSIPYPLDWFAVLATGFTFAFSLGLVLAAIVNALPESMFVIRMLFFPVYIVSGVIIPPSHLPPQFLSVLLWNPFLHLSELTHMATLENYVPIQGISFYYVFAWTVGLMFVGLGLYRVLRLKYIAITR